MAGPLNSDLICGFTTCVTRMQRSRSIPESGGHLASKMSGHASAGIPIQLDGQALPDATAEAAATMNQVLSQPCRKDNRDA